MTAVAIKDDMIAPSLGAASVFILAEGEKVNVKKYLLDV